MKKVILSIEALLLLGPMAVLIISIIPVTFYIGIPVAFNQPVEITKNSLLFYFWVIGISSGIYAIGFLLNIVWSTIKDRKIVKNAWFYSSIALGIIASICLVYIFREFYLKAIFLGIMPVTIAATHFIWLQNKL